MHPSSPILLHKGTEPTTIHSPPKAKAEKPTSGQEAVVKNTHIMNTVLFFDALSSVLHKQLRAVVQRNTGGYITKSTKDTTFFINEEDLEKNHEDQWKTIQGFINVSEALDSLGEPMYLTTVSDIVAHKGELYIGNSSLLNMFFDGVRLFLYYKKTSLQCMCRQIRLAAPLWSVVLNEFKKWNETGVICKHFNPGRIRSTKECSTFAQLRVWAMVHVEVIMAFLSSVDVSAQNLFHNRYYYHHIDFDSARKLYETFEGRCTDAEFQVSLNECKSRAESFLRRLLSLIRSTNIVEDVNGDTLAPLDKRMEEYCSRYTGAEPEHSPVPDTTDLLSRSIEELATIIGDLSEYAPFIHHLKSVWAVVIDWKKLSVLLISKKLSQSWFSMESLLGHLCIHLVGSQTSAMFNDSHKMQKLVDDFLHDLRNDAHIREFFGGAFLSGILSDAVVDNKEEVQLIEVVKRQRSNEAFRSSLLKFFDQPDPTISGNTENCMQAIIIHLYS